MRFKTVRLLALPTLLLIALPMLMGGCGWWEGRQHLNKAETLFEKHDLTGARQELLLAIKANPDSVEAHESLCNIDLLLKKDDEAGQQAVTVASLDPTNMKYVRMAQQYHDLKRLENSSGSALEDVKAGNVTAGLNTLMTVIENSTTEQARKTAVTNLTQALPIAAKQGDQLMTQMKYKDALDDYIAIVRGYMLLARANKSQNLDSGVEPVLHSVNEAADKSGQSYKAFAILNDVIGSFPTDKAANLELAQAYLKKTPPDYETAAELMEQGGAPASEVKKLHAEARRAEHHR